MARCLAVNTANTLMSVALMEGDDVAYAWQTEQTRDQGNLLLHHAGAGLQAAGWSYDSLDLLAVVTGPGSFTGIRIGLAAMRGLAMAAGLPLAGVTSFELYARPLAGALNLVAIESWREELYFQGMDAAGNTVVSPVNETPEAFAARVKAYEPNESKFVISGDAAHTLHAALPHAACANMQATAETAARIALKRLAEQGLEAFSTRPAPYYLRAADVTISSKKRP